MDYRRMPEMESKIEKALEEHWDFVMDFSYGEPMCEVDGLFEELEYYLELDSVGPVEVEFFKHNDPFEVIEELEEWQEDLYGEVYFESDSRENVWYWYLRSIVFHYKLKEAVLKHSIRKYIIEFFSNYKR
jgi:hypothetical protein